LVVFIFSLLPHDGEFSVPSGKELELTSIR